MNDELLDLASQVRDALGWLNDALETAGTMCQDETGERDPDTGQPITRPNGWKAMEEVCDRLEAARKILETALDPVQDSIDAAQKYLDDGPDEVDPSGFKYHPKA